MKMNKKGFTLIELLAVIVILAIIALIATPIILGVINDAKKSAAIDSAYGFIEAVETNNALANITPGNYTKIESTDDVTTLNVKVKGTKPTSGTITIEKDRVKEATLVINGYTVKYDGQKATIDGEKIEEEKPNTEEEKPTEYSVYANGTAVYYNPESGEKCSASEAISTTGTKTGCMKWYTFNDEGKNADKVNMILDHTTTARIKWNDSNSNVAYESSNLKAVVDDLVTTSGWRVTPRLITASEVNTIVGEVSTWDVNDYNTWFYFEGTGTKNQTKLTYDSSNRSSYDWLYNNLNKCKSDSTDYGCTIEDKNTYTGYGTAGEGQTFAYWTSTPVGTSGSGSRVWGVSRRGLLSYDYANDTGYGVRPVITVSKSIIS